MRNVTGVTVSSEQIPEMTAGERQASKAREASNNLEEKI